MVINFVLLEIITRNYYLITDIRHRNNASGNDGIHADFHKNDSAM